MQSQLAQPNNGDEQSIFKAVRSPGANVETLEERALFSGGLSAGWGQAVVFESAQHPTQVYDMPLNVHVAKTPAVHAPAVQAVQATPATGESSRVKLLQSDDDHIVVGFYTNGQPLRAGAPTSTAVSFRGNDALIRLDTQSFAGRPPALWKASTPVATRRRVLLIEDDATSRVALATLLTRRGWVVSSASTVKEGLSHLSEHPDNVIMDLMLPDGKGEDVLEQIRKSHLDAKVTVMTGVSDPARLARLHELHPESVLNKPINLPALLRAISRTN